MTDQASARTMTAAEFLTLPESSTPLELIDGELIMAPSPQLPHQNIVYRLSVLLSQVPGVGLDDVFPAPTDVHFDDGNVLQPDMVWLSPDNERCIRVGTKHLRGAPDLVIEVLSPATATHDTGKKRQVYERHGVREYWLVDGAKRQVEVLVLRGEKFVQAGVFAETERFTSPVLQDATIDVRKIFPAS